MSYIWDIKSGYSTRSGIYKTKLERIFIFKRTANKKMKILDIGGGSGRFAIPLAEAGNQVTVIEPNKEAIKLLKKRNDNIVFINKIFENYKTEKKFDLILAMEALGNFCKTDYFF